MTTNRAEPLPASANSLTPTIQSGPSASKTPPDTLSQILSVKQELAARNTPSNLRRFAKNDQYTREMAARGGKAKLTGHRIALRLHYLRNSPASPMKVLEMMEIMSNSDRYRELVQRVVVEASIIAEGYCEGKLLRTRNAQTNPPLENQDSPERLEAFNMLCRLAKLLADAGPLLHKDLRPAHANRVQMVQINLDGRKLLVNTADGKIIEEKEVSNESQS